MLYKVLLASFCFLLSHTANALPESEMDFWQWLAPQLTFSEFQHPDIDAWEARYRRRHAELEVILNQGKEYLYPLALAVRDRGMPMEIALLPIIESHLDSSAVSKSGAHGLWQLLPSTAKHLGLNKDWWHDESADFSRSTNAALDYLDYLHDRFGGWLLGLAAYNAGEGRIYGQMRQRNKRGLATDYWDLDLNAESRNYVPKLLGLARVLRRPGPIKLPKLLTRRSFVRVDTAGPMDITQIAKLSQVRIETIYRLNPQLLRWAVPPNGPYSVYLPRRNSQIFNQALKHFPADQRRRWHRYQVKHNDTLERIAGRYSSSVDLLKRLNGLQGDTIRPGEHLIIANHADNLSHLSVVAARRQTRLNYAERSIPAGYHEVQSGDSLWSIAKYYGSSVQTLRSQNNLTAKHSLFPGQLLKVGNADKRRRIFYEVKPGDALSLIAQRYEVSVRQIRSWNGLDGSLLHPGQKLRLLLPASTS